MDTSSEGRENAGVARPLVTVNKQGRITLPIDTRRRLGLHEGRQLEVVVDGGEIRLRPATVVPAEDAWAYTPEALRSLRRALEHVTAGRVFRSSPEDLERRVRAQRRRKRR